MNLRKYKIINKKKNDKQDNFQIPFSTNKSSAKHINRFSGTLINFKLHQFNDTIEISNQEKSSKFSNKLSNKINFLELKNENNQNKNYFKNQFEELQLNYKKSNKINFDIIQNNESSYLSHDFNKTKNKNQFQKYKNDYLNMKFTGFLNKAIKNESSKDFIDKNDQSQQKQKNYEINFNILS